MITKEKMRTVFMVMYAIIIGFLSYTSFNSPFMMREYTNNVMYTSLLILFTSFYLFDFKYVKIWFKKQMFDAKIRAMQRKDAADIIKRRYEAYGKV